MRKLSMLSLMSGFGALAAISRGFEMPRLPEMRVSRQVHNYRSDTPRSGYRNQKWANDPERWTNRERECARRRRQIAAGGLKRENGLAVSRPHGGGAA